MNLARPSIRNDTQTANERIYQSSVQDAHQKVLRYPSRRRGLNEREYPPPQLQEYVSLSPTTTPRVVHAHYQSKVFSDPLNYSYRYMVFGNDVERTDMAEMGEEGDEIIAVFNFLKWAAYLISPECDKDDASGRAEKRRADEKNKMAQDDTEMRAGCFRSFHTEAKHPLMEGKLVKYLWTRPKKNSLDRVILVKVELVSYKEWPLSISTAVVHEDEADNNLGGEDGRYRYYETLPSPKERKHSTTESNFSEATATTTKIRREHSP